jgi:uncharacterized membrane protein YeiH
VRRLHSPVLLFDAVCLAFFAVVGAQKAITFGLSPLMEALLGMLTGIGDGMVRDMLLTEIPHVLRSDLYAAAALAGASVVVIGDSLGLPYAASVPVGGVLRLALRFMAIRYGLASSDGGSCLTKTAGSRHFEQGEAEIAGQ